MCDFVSSVLEGIVSKMNSETPPYVCIFDIETQQKINDMNGKFREDKIRQLSISCASVVKIPSELCLDPENAERAMEMATTKTFWVDGEGSESLEAMCKLLVKAELIVGYNLASFDWAVSKKYFRTFDDYNGCCERTLDVFSRVRDVTGKWFKLDSLLKLNHLETKSADGLQAIDWWKQGERELLKQYCELDTQLCARLALLPKLSLGGDRFLKNYNFGIASALVSIRAF